MNKLNSVFKLLLVGAFSQLVFADPPNWDPAGLGYLNNFTDYEFNGSVTAKIYPDGSEGGQLGDMTAAFVDDEQRGVAHASEVPSFLGNGYAFLMMVYSGDAAGTETFSFQLGTSF